MYCVQSIVDRKTLLLGQGLASVSAGAATTETAAADGSAKAAVDGNWNNPVYVLCGITAC